MTSTFRLALLFSSLVLGGGACSSTPRTAATPNLHDVEVPPRRETSSEPPPPPPGPRTLARDASFADLVALAASLDSNGEGDSDESCLLHVPPYDSWPWIVGADLALAVRPLPAPPEDLDERLMDSTAPVLVISRWGQIGGRSFDVALAAFTSAPQLGDQPSLVVVLTNRGAYLRRTSGRVPANGSGPRPIPQVARELTQGLAPDSVVYVTAEAAVSIATIADLLERLAESSHVALAVALGPRITIPPPPPPRPDRGAGLCPFGLPEPPQTVQPGMLSPERAMEALSPLRRTLRACLREASGEGPAGGRTLLRLRVMPDGAVSEACLADASIGGPLLRACIIEAAEQQVFPRPSPQGFVDIELPLLLTPTYQRPLCHDSSPGSPEPRTSR